MARATTSVLLLGDDYAERLNSLYAQVQAAQDDADRADRDAASARTLLEGDPVQALDAEYRELKEKAEAEAEADQRSVLLRAPANGDWREFKKKHPPRTDGAEDDLNADKVAGFNTDSDDAAFDLVHLMIERPEFKTRGAFDEWANDHLSPGEWDVVVRRAYNLAVGARFDPKPSPASLIQRSEQS